MNDGKLVNKIGGGYIEIGIAALTHEYSIMEYAIKKMDRKCFEPYM